MHQPCGTVNEVMSEPGLSTSDFNYEAAWQGAWNDATRYGPACRHRRRIVINLVRELPHRRILDLGCGDGLLLAEISKKIQAELIGADVSATAIEHARRNVPHAHFEVLDAGRAIPEGTFDVTVMSEVLEHIEDDDALLRNLAAHTRFVVISVPGGPADQVDRAYGHFRNYDGDLLPRKLRAAGYEVVKFRRWGFPFYEWTQLLLHRGPADRTAVAGGRYGLTKKFIATLLYAVFFLNILPVGSQVFAVGRSLRFKESSH